MAPKLIAHFRVSRHTLHQTLISRARKFSYCKTDEEGGKKALGIDDVGLKKVTVKPAPRLCRRHNPWVDVGLRSRGKRVHK